MIERFGAASGAGSILVTNDESGDPKTFVSYGSEFETLAFRQ